MEETKISIGSMAMRKFAILLLDEPNGIKKEAYETLSVMLVESGNEDILDEVYITEDRAYVGEDFAEAELGFIENDPKEEGCASDYLSKLVNKLETLKD